MAIADDASFPGMAFASASASATLASASFTPPSNSLLIAQGAAEWNTNYTGTPASTITYSDSLSGTWTPINNKNSGAGGATMVSTAYRIIGSSAAMTVTATFIDTLSKSQFLYVSVLTGTALSSTIASSLLAVTGTTADFTQQSVTTTTTGSKVIMVVAHDNFETSMVVNANTVQYDQWQDSAVSGTSASGRSASLTGTPGSISLGWTGSAAGFQKSVIAIEVMPAAASTVKPRREVVKLQSVNF